MGLLGAFCGALRLSGDSSTIAARFYRKCSLMRNAEGAANDESFTVGGAVNKLSDAEKRSDRKGLVIWLTVWALVALVVASPFYIREQRAYTKERETRIQRADKLLERCIPDKYAPYKSEDDRWAESGALSVYLDHGNVPGYAVPVLTCSDADSLGAAVRVHRPASFLKYLWDRNTP